MSRQRRPARQNKGRKANNVTRDFWGNPESVPDLVTSIRPAQDPSAVIRSLGQPPLAGHETIAEHYFRAVYDKAAGLATALAAGSGLLDTGTEDRG